MVTERDRSVVVWAAVIGAVSAQDVMAQFGLGRTVGLRGAIASAGLGRLPGGRSRLRRPNLVLFPPDPARPVAVEVELSVKAARRLEAICRAWARCRFVSEVRYYAPPHVARAVSRAVSVVHAHDVIRVVALDDALNPRRWLTVSGSPLDPVVHLFTTLAIVFVSAAVMLASEALEVVGAQTARGDD